MPACKTARFVPSILAAGMLAACNSSGGTTAAEPAPSGRKQTVPNACALFTEDIAAILGSAPFDAPTDETRDPVSLCQRISTRPVQTDQGTYARIEKVSSREAFQSKFCTALSDDSYGKFEFTPLDGIGEAACEVNWESVISVAAYQNGYALQVGNSTREKCIQAINLLFPKLPK